MSRRPGYETASYIGPAESRRETMAHGQGPDIGRPRGAAARAAARRGGLGQDDDGEHRLMVLKTRLRELGG